MRCYLPIQWKRTAHGSATWRRPPSALGVVLPVVLSWFVLTAGVGAGAGDQESVSDRPVLSREVADRVNRLEMRIDKLRREYRAGRDEAIHPAIQHAEEVLAIRRENQKGWTNADGELREWYEVGDARRSVEDLHLLASLTNKQRRELYDADELIGEEIQLYRSGSYAEAVDLRVKILATHRRVLGADHLITLISMSNLGRLLHDHGKLDEAEEYMSRVIARTVRVLGDDHPLALSAIDSLGRVLQDQGNLVAAERAYRRALEGRVRVLTADHPATLTSFNNLGVVLVSQENLDAAEALLQRAVQGRLRILGDDHPANIDSLVNLGSLFHDQGRLDEAENSFRKAIDGHLPEDHRTRLSAMHRLGTLLTERQELGEAQKYLRAAVEGRRRVLTDDHYDTLNSIYSLGVVLMDLEQLEEAEGLMREAVDGLRRLLPPEHVHTLTSIHNLGLVLKKRGKLNEAKDCFLETVEGRRRVLADEHADTLDAIYQLGIVLRDLAEMDQAERSLREVVQGRHKVLPRDHVDTLDSMSSLGVLLTERGKFDEAEDWLRQSLEGYRRLRTDDYSSTVALFHNLGVLLREVGKLDEAEVFLRKAAQGHIKLFTLDHVKTLNSMHTLAIVLLHRGEFGEAEEYIRMALDGYGRILGDDHLTTLSVLNSLSHVHNAQGNLAEGEECLRRVLKGRRRILTDEHPDTLAAFHNLGSFLSQHGKLDEAEELLRKAVSGYRRVLSNDHPDTLRAVGMLGLVLNRQGKLDEAEEYLRESLAGRRRLFTDYHPSTLTAINNLAILLMERGDTVEAERLYREALSVAEHLRTRVLGEELSRATYAAELGLASMAAELSVFLIGTNRPDEALTVSERARSRALLDLLARRDLDIVEQARRRVLQGGDVADLEALKRALETEEDMRIAASAAEALLVHELRNRNLVEGQTDSGDDTSRRAELDMRITEHRQAVRAARLALTEASSNTLVELRGLLPAATPMAVGAVRAELEQDELILSYLWDDHVVLLLTAPASGSGQVKGFVLALGPQAVEAVTDLVGKARAGIVRSGNPAPPDAGAAKQLADWLIPRGVQDQVQAAGRVIVLPDGPLNGIPFELLLSQGFDTEIVYANSATMYFDRRSVAHEKIRVEQPSAVVLGDPVFNRERLQEPPKPLDIVARGSEQGVAEISATDQIRLHGGALRPLPGTRSEAERVAKIFKEQGNEARLLLDENATAQRLFGAVDGATYVHLATHGLNGSRDRPYDASLALTQPQQITPDDNGFLRLDDIIASWRGKLQSCELVVLSACHTQHGVDIGDSVVSLPWGFFYAGAPTVIASLWQVDDRATALLMERLYENLLGAFDDGRSVHGRKYEARQPMTKLDALDEAKQWLRTLPPMEARERVLRGGKENRPPTAQGVEEVYDFSHPYYWAAFILIGSPD